MFAAFAAAFITLPAVQAMFILTTSTLVTERLDPIVTPGNVSSHVHTILGASNFNPNVNVDQQMASNCTTVPVQADKSLYWAPTLFHRAQDGTFDAIDLSFANLYYLQRNGPTQKDIKAVPKGLRMIAGNLFRTAYNASNVQDKAISFVCLNYNNPRSNGSPQPTFPQGPCPDGLRLQIFFPSCWDGKNLDSPNHKSHVSYPVGGAPDSGDCPATHPVKMVVLFTEYTFDTGRFDYISGGSSWVLSTGDDTGLTLHADYMAGWDVPVLQAAIDQCNTNLFGDLEACPPLVPSLNRDLATKCSIASVVEENVQSPGKTLPGCNPFTPGRPNAVPPVCVGLKVPPIAGLSSA